MAIGDLTSIANVEQWLGLPAGCKDEALLTRLITAASAFMATWCGRQFASQTFSEVYNGTGGAALSLRQSPITAVASLAIDGQAVPASPGVPQFGYLFTDTQLILFGWRFARGRANVAVTYTAGYVAIPADLEQACLDLVAFKYREIQHIGHTSKGMAGETTAYLVKDMPPAVATALAAYRRVALS